MKEYNNFFGERDEQAQFAGLIDQRVLEKAVNEIPLQLSLDKASNVMRVNS